VENNKAEDKSIVSIQLPDVVYSVTDESVKQLAKKYKNVPDASTEDGMELIKEGLRELVPLRTGVEKARKLLKADSLEYGRKVDAEAKRITSELVTIEKPFADAKKVEDDKAEKERQAEINREQIRMEALEARLGQLKAFTEGLMGAPATAIQERLKSLESFPMEGFEEYHE